jgi:photosystem II stability/assembly factor-like uncharacterized protein
MIGDLSLLGGNRMLRSSTGRGWLKITLASLSLMMLSGCTDHAPPNTTAPPTRTSSESNSQAQKSSKLSDEDSGLAIPKIKSAAFVGPGMVWLSTRQTDSMLHTETGGAVWERLPSNIDRDTVITFIDPYKGWLVKSSDDRGQVWHTSDGGKNWSIISSITPTRDPFLSPIQIEFVDETHGWLIETFSIWRTQDGGKRWVEVLSTDDSRLTGQPSRGFFLNELKAWVCGTYGQLYTTANGGRTWRVQRVDEDSESSDIFFVDEHTGWLSRSSNGQLYRTDDGGRSWQLQPPLSQNVYIKSCYFISKDEGWGVGEQLLEGSRGLSPVDYISKGLVHAIALHTVDGGKTWQPSLVEKSQPFFDRVHFTHPEHGWLVSRDNVYRTTDAGRSWQVTLNLESANY